jgi:excisionase family DNA binding protein
VIGNTFSVQDVADRFGVSVRTALTWIGRGELRAVHVGRNPRSKKPRWRISEMALAAFEAARASDSPTPRAPRRKRAAEVVLFY